MKHRLQSVLLVALGIVPMVPVNAEAIPAFARKYNVSCNLCHSPAPRLNAFGEAFAGNGFEMSVAEEPRDTLDTGDRLLRLLKRIDFALRLDLFANAITPVRAADATVDLQMPYNVKLLTGGALAHKISYYMYFFLSERGEVAGLEDAYIQFTDIAGSGVSVIAGQFQVSDPLFKRETRLEYDDYQPYRFRVGTARTDLTYDRGLFASYSPWEGGDLALILVNGNGLDEAEADRQYDTDALKNAAVRYSQDVFGPLRLGGYAYFGKQYADGIDDVVRIYGPDATLSLGNVELNAQYLWRTDSNPFFAPAGAPDVDVNSAFVELIWSPSGRDGRWHATGLYNWIDADAPVINMRLEDPALLSRYQTLSGSLHYLLQRNVRVLTDIGYDFETESARFTLGAFLAW